MHTLTRSRPRRRTWIGIDHSTKNNRALIHKVDMSQLLSSFTVVPFWSLFFSSQLKSVFLLFYSRPPTLGTTLYRYFCEFLDCQWMLPAAGAC
jgi:hypothetical protein